MWKWSNYTRQVAKLAMFYHAAGFSLLDGSHPAPLWPSGRPQGGGKFAVAPGHIPSFVGKLTGMRITMSFFSKQTA